MSDLRVGTFHSLTWPSVCVCFALPGDETPVMSSWHVEKILAFPVLSCPLTLFIDDLCFNSLVLRCLPNLSEIRTPLFFLCSLGFVHLPPKFTQCLLPWRCRVTSQGSNGLFHGHHGRLYSCSPFELGHSWEPLFYCAPRKKPCLCWLQWTRAHELLWSPVLALQEENVMKWRPALKRICFSLLPGPFLFHIG